MYVGSVDIRGVYCLLFELFEAVIDCTEKTNIVIELYAGECDTLYIKCNFLAGKVDHLWIEEKKALSFEIVKALSCDFDLRKEQDSFKLRFKPDREIFSYDTIEYNRLFLRLKELAQLNENVKFLLSDNENKNVIQFQNGLEVMLMEGVYGFGLPSGYKPLNIHFSKNDVEVSGSMIYAHTSDVALSYVNNNRTHDGGTHVQGLHDGILDAFQEYIQNSEIETKIVKDHPLFFINEEITGTSYVFDENPNILKEDVVENLNFVISVKMKQPFFSGSTRRVLANEEVYSIIKHGVMECLKRILISDPYFFYSSRVISKAEIRKMKER